jgi:uncharacterized protein YndB with AHSA1/START domain
MAEYRFVTFWHIEAPLQRVFDAISDSLRWPDWWHGALAVEERAAGATDGVGAVRRYHWKSRLPYHLSFDARTTRIEPPITLEAVVSGDLEGCGRWSFSHENGITSIRYDWHVHTTRPWMNLFAPIARRLFSENHHALMRQGAEGLARLLDARLTGIRYEDLHRAANPRQAAAWAHAAAAGIAAGTVATVAQMALWRLAAWPLREMLWRDTRLAAAIVMGRGVLPPPETFDWTILGAASAVHTALSIVYGLVLAPLVMRLNLGLALAAGALFGLLLYGVNMYGFTAVFPWFEASRDWITMMAHLVFGITLAAFCKYRNGRGRAFWRRSAR